jgi:hypothetical protein
VKVFFPVHQDATCERVARFPAEELNTWIGGRADSIAGRIVRSRCENDREVDCIVVNIWLLTQSVPPSNIRHSRKHREISVEVGVDATAFPIPPSLGDFETILRVGELALSHAIEKYGMELRES